MSDEEIEQRHRQLDKECDEARDRDRTATPMKFDFARHTIVDAGELFGTDHDYEFFNCVLCGELWEPCDRVYVVDAANLLGRCCPDCEIILDREGAKYIDLSHIAGSA